MALLVQNEKKKAISGIFNPNRALDTRMQLSKCPFPALGLGRHAQLDDFVGVALRAGSSEIECSHLHSYKDNVDIGMASAGN